MLYYVITTAAWVLARKAVIDLLGIEYQGADGLFTNIITMLSIAELGLGSAIVYHLYYPLSVNDRETVKSLSAFYRKCYYIVAVVILLLGTGVIPLVPSLIKDYTLKYPVWQVYIWFLLDSVCSYIISYRRSVLMADQKNYIVILTDAVFAVITKAAQIAVLRITGSFLLYLSLMWFFRLAENVFLHIYTGKRYPYLEEKNVRPLSKDILSDIKEKVKGAVFHNVAGFIVLGTDNILISRFLGLAAAGIYSNYYLLIRALKSICTKFVSAPKASIGHLLTLCDDEKNREVFREMQIFNFITVCCATCGLLFAATPLVSAMFGPSFILDRFTVTVLAFNFYVQGMRGVYNVFKEAAGILYEDRYVPVCESVLNIIASLAFMRFFGLAGVFLGTIFSSVCLYAYTYPVLVVKGLLHAGYGEYITEMIWRLLVLVASFVLTGICCRAVSTDNVLLEILLRIIAAGLISVFCSVMLYAVWHRAFMRLIKRMLLMLKK